MARRFTRETRAVVIRAVADAEARRSPVIDVEHLLRALTDGTDPATTATLAAAGVTGPDIEAVFAEVDLAARRGGLGPEDAEALRSIGIDVDAVVSGVEAEHGPGALAPPTRRRAGIRRGPLREHRPFTPAARKVLENTVRAAIEDGAKRLRTEHVLLGVVAGSDPVARALGRRGLTPETVRRAASTRG